MKLANFFPFMEYRMNYIQWCLRYPRLWNDRFCIGHGSHLNIGPRAQLQLGQGVHFMHHFHGDFYGKITIGDRVWFQHNCHISVHEELTIGDYSIFGEGVSIHDENHVITAGSDPIGDRGYIVKPVTIGRNVWVGAKATILAGVHIGDNAVIAANAVVTHDVPAYTIVGGVPARVLRHIEPSAQPVLNG